MKLRRFVLIASVLGALSAAMPVAPAAASTPLEGEVTVQDPVRHCDHTYGWSVDTQDPGGTRVYSKGDCSN